MSIVISKRVLKRYIDRAVKRAISRILDDDEEKPGYLRGIHSLTKGQKEEIGGYGKGPLKNGPYGQGWSANQTGGPDKSIMSNNHNTFRKSARGVSNIPGAPGSSLEKDLMRKLASAKSAFKDIVERCKALVKNAREFEKKLEAGSVRQGTEVAILNDLDADANAIENRAKSIRESVKSYLNAPKVGANNTVQKHLQEVMDSIFDVLSSTSKSLSGVIPKVAKHISGPELKALAGTSKRLMLK